MGQERPINGEIGSALSAGVSPFSRGDFRGFPRSCGYNGYKHQRLKGGKGGIPFGGAAFLTKDSVRGLLGQP